MIRTLAYALEREVLLNESTDRFGRHERLKTIKVVPIGRLLVLSQGRALVDLDCRTPLPSLHGLIFREGPSSHIVFIGTPSSTLSTA